MKSGTRGRVTIARMLLVVAAIAVVLGAVVSDGELAPVLLMLSPLGAIPLALEANRRDAPRP